MRGTPNHAQDPTIRGATPANSQPRTISSGDTPTAFVADWFAAIAHDIADNFGASSRPVVARTSRRLDSSASNPRTNSLTIPWAACRVAQRYSHPGGDAHEFTGGSVRDGQLHA
ncbi:hypothetical protein F3087_33705 [Nocardia colli]|uniref:Uncharacterized protein n=1 Tax=Nocardia colli TaxID=2545717 RepID=A0A5N0E6G8_9NOCA|nr:hypothetical protein [Nocardia colli]KAA8884546.1 hypothetical protein F3087_33705 [Nocardia colli]